MVWISLSIYLILNGPLVKALFLISWGTLVVSTIDNFLRPKLIKNQTKLHELFVFFSVLGGMSLFGVLGIVPGPVGLAITLGLRDSLQQSQETEVESSDPKVSQSNRSKPTLVKV